MSRWDPDLPVALRRGRVDEGWLSAWLAIASTRRRLAVDDRMERRSSAPGDLGADPRRGADLSLSPLDVRPGQYRTKEEVEDGRSGIRLHRAPPLLDDPVRPRVIFKAVEAKVKGRDRGRGPLREESPVADDTPPFTTRKPSHADREYREALNQRCPKRWKRDPTSLLMGKRSGTNQGAYRGLAGAPRKFGEKRVIDTPIADVLCQASACGAAMVGLRPIIVVHDLELLAGGDRSDRQQRGPRSVRCGWHSPSDRLPRALGSRGQVASQHCRRSRLYYAYSPVSRW